MTARTPRGSPELELCPGEVETLLAAEPRRGRPVTSGLAPLVRRAALAAGSLLLVGGVALLQLQRGSLLTRVRQSDRPPQSLVALQSGHADQAHAEFAAGAPLRVYVVGSSNVVWVTWVEQLHLLLQRLGFQLPEVHATEDPVHGPTDAPECEDSNDYKFLRTTRIGEPGWGSWGFAYEGANGCSGGYRWIGGTPVNCSPSWGCPHAGPKPLHLSRIAADAAGSDVALFSCWINDSKQYATNNICFNSTKVSREATAALSVANLLRMVRAVHARNPKVWVVVLALYPDVVMPTRAVDPNTLPTIREINRRVREGLAGEPRTLFADYAFPNNVDLFQVRHFGHPNCRASKLMANGVVDALYGAGVLGRGLADGGSCDVASSINNCKSLSQACCQRAARCRLLDGKYCVSYGPGN